MWWLIWAVLVLAALVVLCWLSWRLFVSVRALLGEIGSTTSSVGRAGQAAARLHEDWVELRRTEDKVFHHRMAELARPRPAGLQIPADNPTDSPTYDDNMNATKG